MPRVDPPLSPTDYNQMASEYGTNFIHYAPDPINIPIGKTGKAVGKTVGGLAKWFQLGGGKPKPKKTKIINDSAGLPLHGPVLTPGTGSRNTGSSSQKTAQNILNKGSGGKSKPTGSGNKSTSGGKGGSNPNLTQAQETIAAQMNPQLAEYQHEIGQQKLSSKQQQSDLADLYRRLGINIDANTAAGDAANATAQTNIGNKYDALRQQIDSTYGAATGATNSELGRLGIQEAGPAATADLNRDHTYLGQLAGLDKTNAVTNSQAKSQSFDNLLTTLKSQGQLSGTQQQAAVIRGAAAALSDLQSKRGALAATRRGAVDALYRQLTAASNKAQIDKAQQNFMDQIAAGKLGVEQGNLGVAQGRLGVSAGTLALNQKNSVQTRDLKRAQALKAFHDAHKPYTSSSASTNYKGFTGGLAFLNSQTTGKNVYAKSELQKAENIYRSYYRTQGANALIALQTRIQNNQAPEFINLPGDLQALVIQALHISNKV